MLQITRQIRIEGDSLARGSVNEPGETPGDLLDAGSDNQGIIVTAVGGSKSGLILDRLQALTPCQIAEAGFLFDMGRNDFNGATYPDVVPNSQTAHTKIDHPYRLQFGDPNSQNEPRGSVAWARMMVSNRRRSWAHGGRFAIYRDLMIRSGDGGALDDADVARDVVPRSLRRMADGSIDPLHFGKTGNELIVDYVFKPALHALEGGVFVPPDQDIMVVTGSAQLNGGTVAQVPMIGEPTSCAMSGDDAQFFAISSSGLITKAVSQILRKPYYDLIVTANKTGFPTSEGRVRLFLCSASGFPPYEISCDGQSWATQDAGSGANLSKGSLVVALRCGEGTNGTRMYVASNADDNNFYVVRGIDHRIQMVMRDSSGSVVLNLRTGASTGPLAVNSNNGMMVVYFSWDLTLGTPLLQSYVNDVESIGGAVSAVSGGVFTQDESLVVGARTPAGESPFVGSKKLFWMSGVPVDWSVSANRAALLNGLYPNGALIPQGGSLILPKFCIGGRAADWALPRNRGTGGFFATAIKPGAVIAEVT